ncbi:MAG: hypothetical protein M3P96_12630 [Actinomycetota bacterium]|nr:hypothetical protein [Actinomycetota bacterium]
MDAGDEWDAGADPAASAPYAAYLRVYEPVAVFPEPQRSRWQEQAKRQLEDRAAEDPDGRLAATRAERLAALAGLVHRPPSVVPERESDEAFVLVLGGAAYACPLETRLRSWEALLDFARGIPEGALAAFVPEAELERVRREAGRWQAAHPEHSAHIRTSTWYVPLAWLPVFDAPERELRLGGQRMLVYRTAMSQARRRMARALRTLRETVEGEEADAVEEVARWLEEFHPRSVVELDYGGLLPLLDDRALVADDSVAEAAEGLAALQRRDDAGAAAAYARLVERWSALRARERAN